MCRIDNEEIQVWGGIECSINRIDNEYYDQLQMVGYYSDAGQLKSIIELGIKIIRFPLLWEKHEPRLNETINWSWAENNLDLLQANDITPVIGLLHHGSGPAFTDLLNKNFPELFAGYAAKVAAQFPWLTYYNPINEPLTTARFSGLYGLWYPHKTNDVSFIRILLNELRAITLAMEEIRKINPNAKLIQTEDLGKTYSTTLLEYQANFENHRRWLTYDILSGQFNDTHPLWNYLTRLGIEKESLQFFIDRPCIPDIIGVNHYITSERYLDEDIANYPPCTHGGNGIHRYADAEAVRVEMQQPNGLSVLLTEMWERYHLPIAITEVHIHCTREEQVRWLKEVYNTAVLLKNKNIKICAITAWALLGSFGWNKLLTSFPGEYETGAFDTSAGMVRPTALAKMIKNLVVKTHSFEELTQVNGWWKKNDRYFINSGKKNKGQHNFSVKPILILGTSGTLGNAFARACADRSLHYVCLSSAEVDICSSEELGLMIKHIRPWAIINVGLEDSDKAIKDQQPCYKNKVSSQKLAVLCEREKIKFLTFSTDQVFDGATDNPYKETDPLRPLNIYGHCSQLTESFVSGVNPASLIIRTSAFFGSFDKTDFINKMIAAVSAGINFIASNNIRLSLTYIPHLIHAGLDLLIDDASGIWHLVNKGNTTWYEFAKTAALQIGLETTLIIPHHTLPIHQKFRVLTSEKYTLMPTLEKALEEYLSRVDKIEVMQSLKK